MQFYGIANKEFGIEYKLSSKEKSNQAIALYALSAKFQIYYVLDSFEAIKMNEKEIAIYPTQIKAYVDDSFDFRDSPNQTVGVWDYEKIVFDCITSVAMVLKYFYNKDIIKITEDEEKILALKYRNNRANNLNRGAMYYHLYNQDYQNTQTFFYLGCDFIATSKSFKDILVLQDTRA
ncbi:hypothetical protein B6S12_08425 [Helicobacter valdiviensis]|uniref:Uncharacterized protein n=2 Tax=Helicobacter valdiviensis TaxID=1458358 RepID=A0A2W6MSY9_9HELI|nr:hypothetical protein B6S12_08425 [Helicobacter valdiviensis]